MILELFMELPKVKKRKRCRFSKVLTNDPRYPFGLLSLLTEAYIIYVLLPSNKATWARTKNPGLGDVGS
jgi:hypothetical protein